MWSRRPECLKCHLGPLAPVLLAVLLGANIRSFRHVTAILCLQSGYRMLDIGGGDDETVRLPGPPHRCACPSYDRPQPSGRRLTPQSWYPDYEWSPNFETVSAPRSVFHQPGSDVDVLQDDQESSAYANPQPNLPSSLFTFLSGTTTYPTTTYSSFALGCPNAFQMDAGVRGVFLRARHFSFLARHLGLHRSRLLLDLLINIERNETCPR